MRILFLVPPVERGRFCVQTDAVLSRCDGIVSKGNYAVPPIGLAYIAASIRKSDNHELKIVDCIIENFDRKSCLDEIETFLPNVIFVVPGTSTFTYDLKILSKIKKIFPSTKIIAVGAHVTKLPDEILQAGVADIVIRGEPEFTATELISQMAKEKSYAEVAGISYIDRNNVVHNIDRSVGEVDEIPPPARELLKNRKYLIPFTKHQKFTIMLTARGCLYRCIYCSTRIYYRTLWRPRSIKNVISELKSIRNDFGIKDIGIWDDTFTIDKGRVIAICKEIISSKLNIDWICLSRVDTVDKEMLHWMALAGCYQIQYGVESSDQRVLDYLKKDITVQQIRNAFKWTKEVGIEAAAFFMFGAPCETEESIKKSLKFSNELGANYASFNVLTPYPGTELYEMLRKEVIEDWQKYDGRHTCYRTNIKIEKYVNKAYLNFYFKPGYITRKLFSIRNIQEFKKTFLAALRLLKEIV